MDINQEISNTINETYGGYQDNLNKSQGSGCGIFDLSDALNKRAWVRIKQTAS